MGWSGTPFLVGVVSVLIGSPKIGGFLVVSLQRASEGAAMFFQPKERFPKRERRTHLVEEFRVV